MKIFDVTIPISEELVPYPGDPKVKIEQVSRIGVYGSRYTSSIFKEICAHTGTHIDAPAHFIKDGCTIDKIPLDLLMGRVHVVEVGASCIDENALKEFDFTEDVRIFFKTRNSYLWAEPEFDENYVYITNEAARALVNQGIKVVGIDYLSVEKYGVQEFETHKIFLDAGTVIIEGLDLRDVDPGHYEMVCLPLRVKGGEAAPARVILKQQVSGPLPGIHME